MPTIISESFSTHTVRPKVITGLSKGSLLPPAHRNIYVFTLYFSDSSHIEIKTKDATVITQLVQFAFDCEACSGGEEYLKIPAYETVFVKHGGVWGGNEGAYPSYNGFKVYFYDMNGIQTSVVINYKD